MVIKIYYIYMLKCKDDSIYTGITTDVEKRVEAHEKGVGAKYTRGRGPFGILGIWNVKTKSEASKVEYFIKQFSKQKKIEICEKNGFLKKIVAEKKDIVITRKK